MDDGARGTDEARARVTASPSIVIDGTYRLDHELSRGGMGHVHAATHVHLGTRVAVKLLHDEPAAVDAAGGTPPGWESRERFLQEARAAAGLRHPNIVQVLDFGVDGGRPYLVMELLTGETLRERLDRAGTLPPAETARVVDGIAAAVGAAHASGIVHRDLKPDNVFLVDGDPARAKVLDFGVAKVDAPAAAVTTVSGALVGTPAYMSPEQAQGTRAIDGASDRWALGVIAYECLVGRRPFDAEALGELVLQICAWAPPVPSQHADVPVGFDAWFATACAREREARFASAGEQAAALARLCGADDAPRAVRRTPSTSTAATDPHAATVRRLPPPPRPRRAARVAGGVLVAIAVAVVAWWRWPAASAPWTATVSTTRSAATPPGSPAPALPRPLVSLAPPATPPRIAVLPRDDAFDASVAPLADTVTDELTTRLAGRPGLRVIARASVVRLRGQPRPDLAATARELGADHLLELRVTRRGDAVRLALELIAVADGTVAWSRVYARPESELESVCALAASDLAAAVGAGRTTTPPTRDPAAFRAYRTGRGYWTRRDHDSLLQALRYFDEALRIDPDYTEAWVGTVDAALLLPWMGPTPRAEAYARARAALDRAVALAPDHADVQAARGNYLVEVEWKFVDAIAAYRRAVALDPDHASAHQWLAEALAFTRRFDEALAELDLAMQLDPLIPALHKMRQRTLYYAGRLEESLAAGRRGLALDPAQPFASYGVGYSLVRLGRFDEGLAAIMADPMMQLPGIRPVLAAQELWVASRRGDAAAVARLRAEIDRSSLARDEPFVAAFVAAIVGERERVLDLLERGFADSNPWIPQIALVPEFDPYRDEPRFAAMMAKMQL